MMTWIFPPRDVPRCRGTALAHPRRETFERDDVTKGPSVMKKALVISAAISGLLVSGPAWAEHSHEQDRHGKKHANAGGEDDDRDGGRRAAVCYFEPRDAHV